MDDGNEEVHDDIFDSYNIDYDEGLLDDRLMYAQVTPTDTQKQVVAQAILALPTLNRDQIPLEDNCGICLQPFEAIVDAGDGEQLSLELDSEGERAVQEVKLGGVTKLEACGHMFCRLDLIEWIKGFHGTCPACRHQFITIPPSPDDELESVDDDFIPDPDDFMDSDGFTDADDWELDPEEMDLDDPELDAEASESSEEEDRYALECLSAGLAFNELMRNDAEQDELLNPGLSDSFGSEGLEEDEVLASLGQDDDLIHDDTTIHSGQEDGAVGDHGSPISEQSK